MKITEKLAKGGIVTRATRAIIGEAKTVVRRVGDEILRTISNPAFARKMKQSIAEDYRHSFA